MNTAATTQETEPVPDKKEDATCATCGSNDVVVDAWAKWDVTSQQWELDQTFDQAFCNACECECSIEWVEVPACQGNE